MLSRHTTLKLAASVAGVAAFAALFAGSGSSGPTAAASMSAPASADPGTPFELTFTVDNPADATEPLSVTGFKIDDDAGLRARFTLTDPPQTAYTDGGSSWKTTLAPVQIAPGASQTFTYTVEPVLSGELPIKISLHNGDMFPPSADATVLVSGEPQEILEITHDMPASIPMGDKAIVRMEVHNNGLRSQQIGRIKFTKRWSRKVWMWPEFPYEEKDLETDQDKPTVLRNLDMEVAPGKVAAFDWEVDPQQTGTFSGEVKVLGPMDLSAKATADLRLTVE